MPIWLAQGFAITLGTAQEPHICLPMKKKTKFEAQKKYSEFLPTVMIIQTIVKLGNSQKPDFRNSKTNKRVCPNKDVYSGKKSQNK